MRDIIRPTTPYVKSLEPISAEELAKIRCHFYINLGVAEADLEEFDRMFLEQRTKPPVFSTYSRGDSTFHTPGIGGEVLVDWRIYCTWMNTFHLRYTEGLEVLGVKHSNPHIHPDNQHRLANWLKVNNKSPKPLAECDLSMYEKAA